MMMFDLARPQIVDDPLAQALRDIALSAAGAIAMTSEEICQERSHRLGLNKDDDAVDRFGFEHAGERGLLLMRCDDEESLPDRSASLSYA